MCAIECRKNIKSPISRPLQPASAKKSPPPRHNFSDFSCPHRPPKKSVKNTRVLCMYHRVQEKYNITESGQRGGARGPVAAGRDFTDFSRPHGPPKKSKKNTRVLPISYMMQEKCNVPAILPFKRRSLEETQTPRKTLAIFHARTGRLKNRKKIPGGSTAAGEFRKNITYPISRPLQVGSSKKTHPPKIFGAVLRAHGPPKKSEKNSAGLPIGWRTRPAHNISIYSLFVVGRSSL